MRKWMTALGAVGLSIVVGLLVRRTAQDLSDNAQLWRSITDDPDADGAGADAA